MSVDAVPYLDDRQTSRIVALDQQLARTAARSVNDARNDRAKKVAKGRGFIGLGLELVYPRNRHDGCICDESCREAALRIALTLRATRPRAEVLRRAEGLGEPGVAIPKQGVGLHDGQAHLEGARDGRDQHASNKPTPKVDPVG